MRTLARHIGNLTYGVYGPRERDAETLPWITYEDMMADLPQTRWIAARIAAGGGGDAAARVNDAEGIVSAVQQGLGKSLVPAVIGDAVRGLVRLEETSPLPMREIWLLTHPGLHGVRRVQVVADWLRALLKSGMPPMSS